MKHFRFKLKDLKSISTNAAIEHSKYGVSKSDRYRIFEAEFEIKMAGYKNKIDEIQGYFDQDKHCISLEFKFFFNCETKSGRLHKRAGDLTNGIKSLEDALFNLLEIDDAFVTEVRALKIHSDKDSIGVDIWIKEYIGV